MQKAKERHNYQVFSYSGNTFTRAKYSKGKKIPKLILLKTNVYGGNLKKR